jgi:putative redox protein
MMQMEVGFPGNMKVEAKFRGFSVMTDQPVTGGGENSAPTPFELFLASLATCAGIYVKGFCMQRGLDTENIKLIQEVEPGKKQGMLGKVIIKIQVPKDFPKQYHNALISSANLCAVKKHMQDPPEFEIVTEVA